MNEPEQPVAIYARVSTPDQSLDRQLTACHNYATDTLDYELNQTKTYTDKSTGTNIDRSGYEELIGAIREGKHTLVISKSVSRLSRSISDLDNTADIITNENKAELHIIDEGFILDPNESDPFQNAMLRLLGVFAELEAELSRQRTKEGISARMNADEQHHHGRPPIGFESSNGKLYKDDSFDRVANTLRLVAEGNLSKRQAAVELNTTRKTISNAIEKRGDLYGIE